MSTPDAFPPDARPDPSPSSSPSSHAAYAGAPAPPALADPQRRRLLAGVAGLGLLGGAFAADRPRLSAFASAATGLGGLRYAPPAPAPRGGWPLVLWLHGFGLRGSDPWKVADYGLPAVIAGGAAPPCAVLAPQLPASRLRHAPQALWRLIEEQAAPLGADPRRIVLMAASLGTVNAWELAASAPTRIAAALMLAGAGDPAVVRGAGPVPTRLVHGDADRTVPLRKAEAVRDALRAAGAQVALQVLPGVGHDAQALTRAALVAQDGVAWALAQRARPGAGAGTGAPPAPHADDTERMAAWIAGLSRWPHRRPGTAEGLAAEAWLEAELRRIPGLEVGREAVEIPVWQAERSALEIGGNAVPVGFVPFSGFTGAAGVEAPLVHAGGGSARELRKAGARGRIAVIDAAATDCLDDAGHVQLRYPRNLLGRLAPELLAFLDAQRNAEAAGAAGLAVLLDRTCVPSERFYLPYDGVPKPVPAVYVARAAAQRVREAARAGARARLVQTGGSPQGRMHNLWGRLPAARADAPAVWVTSHHDSPWRGVSEDASGVAQVLAQALRWSRVPQAQRPVELWFVLAAGHFVSAKGAYEFAQRRPALLRRTRGVVTVEHVAGREAALRDGRLVATGRPQASVIYTDGASRARVQRALARAPSPATELVRSPFGVPLSDAGGFIGGARRHDIDLPHASWISAPLYLLDPADTLDWLDRDRLAPTARTVDALVDAFVGG